MATNRPLFATPEEAEQAFYEAMREADLPLMMSVWSDEDDIVCVHPGGVRVVGHEPVRRAWAQVFAKGPVFILPVQTVAINGLMSAVRVLVEQAAVESSAQGHLAPGCYATNVYHKGPAGWRMVLHHASPTPREVDVLDLQGRLDTLH